MEELLFSFLFNAILFMLSFHFAFEFQNLQCCSRSAISFHYIKPKEFYVLEYFLYELRPFGVGNVAHTLPAKANMSTLMKKWQHELSNNIFKDED